MDTNQHRSPRGLSELALHALSAAAGKWLIDDSFALALERAAARGALGGALFVLHLTQPDDFLKILGDLEISPAFADELIAEAAGDLNTHIDTHEPATIDIDPT